MIRRDAGFYFVKKRVCVPKFWLEYKITNLWFFDVLKTRMKESSTESISYFIFFDRGSSLQDLYKMTYDFCGKPKINIWSIFVFHHVPSTRNCLQLIMNGGVMNGLWTPLSNLIAPSRKSFRGKTTYRGKVSNQYFVIGWVNL